MLSQGLFTLANLSEFDAHRMRIGRVHTVLVQCASTECAFNANQVNPLQDVDSMRIEPNCVGDAGSHE